MKQLNFYTLCKIILALFLFLSIFSSCVKTTDIIERDDIDIWTNYGSGAIGNNHVLCTIEDNAKSIWVGTSGGGLSKYVNEAWIHYDYESTGGYLVNDTIHSIVQDGYGDFWVATESGLSVYFYHPDYYQWVWSYFEYFSGISITALCVDSSGDVIIGTNGYGLFYYGETNFVQVFDSENPFTNYVNKLYKDKSGNLWCGTFGGLKKYSSDLSTFTLYTTKDGLSNDDIHSVFQDSHGIIWAGGFTESGKVNKFVGGKFQEVSLYNDAISIIYAIGEDIDENIWFGGYDMGAVKYDGLMMKSFFQQDGLPSNTITTILTTEGGDIWFGTDNNGIAKFKPYINF